MSFWIIIKRIIQNKIIKRIIQNSIIKRIIKNNIGTEINLK